MKPVKWPWNDHQIRDIYFDAKDPVEQVFILAELCAKPPEIMLEKLLELKLIPSDEVKEAVLARIRGEPVNPPPEADAERKRKEAERRAKDNERKRMWVLNNPEKAAESARRSWEKLKADPERLERRKERRRQNYAERKKAV